MTKSSTLGHCVGSALLLPLSTGLLDADEVQKVWVYGTVGYEEWHRETLPLLPNLKDDDVSPLEEVTMFLRVLMLKKRASNQLTRLMPTRNGVWEVRLGQTRLFGWFPQPCNLVLTSGVEIETVKGPTGYRPFYKDVLTQRAGLGLGYVGGDIRYALGQI